MDYRTKKTLILGSSIVGGLAVLLLILLVASGIITGKLTYLVDDEVYTEQTGARVKKYSMPADPEKVGYAFGGWYEDKQCKEPFELNSIGFLGLYFGNKTVYAKFENHVHTYITQEKVKPTCTETGISIKICSVPLK